jgi:hypothetical protein
LAEYLISNRRINTAKIYSLVIFLPTYSIAVLHISIKQVDYG